MRIDTDALVIGAGPVGLYTVFQLGLQGIRAQVVDVLAHAGGQCVELYGDKPIYDIPGLPVSTGHDLTDRLLQQVAPFSPGFHFGPQVATLDHQDDGRWHIGTTRDGQPGPEFLARTVFIAAGVGAFVPKPLRVDGLADFAGRQLHYRFDAQADWSAQHVVVHGGDDAAVAAAIALADTQQAASVTLLHRRDVLQADAHALAQVAALRASGALRFVAGQIVGIERDADRLLALQVERPEGEPLRLKLDQLLVCSGLSPRLGPVADWGLAMQRKQLSVDVATFATSAPGIYAAGDIVDYPGKKKLIVCGFHEATLAVFAAAALLHPDAPQVLQYTTSSALLQQRLGVQATSADKP